jgi:hypothetical protein
MFISYPTNTTYPAFFDAKIVFVKTDLAESRR